MIKIATTAKIAPPPRDTAFSQDPKTLLTAFRLMATAKAMTEHYEANFKFVSKYVHATSRGHEAIQIAVGLQLLPQDFAFPYYRDDSMLLGIGMRPYHLMLHKFVSCGGQAAFFDAFNWALSAGGRVPVDQGLEFFAGHR